MIVLWGLPRDGPLAKVADVLAKGRAEVAFVDQMDTVGHQLELSVGIAVQGVIHLGERQVPLEDVLSVYVRPYDFRRIPAVARAGSLSELWKHAEAFDDALLTWTEVTDALVVNRSSAMASNNSKPYQSLMIADAGFSTPATLLTNDCDELFEFHAAHAGVIYKSISGVRSVVRRLDIDERDRMSKLKWCPTQFQAFVPGVDYRVHVVHDQAFVCRVTSAAVDYRYGARDGLAPSLSAATLSDEVTDRCIRLSRSLGLVIAGIDLRQTDAGETYCFEVNPSPGFSYFEDATGQPIAAAVAELLRHPPTMPPVVESGLAAASKPSGPSHVAH
jgi:hypothetical protein